MQQVEDLFLDLGEAGYLGDIELLGHPMSLQFGLLRHFYRPRQ
jgi:hypothetical protein